MSEVSKGNDSEHYPSIDPVSWISGGDYYWLKRLESDLMSIDNGVVDNAVQELNDLNIGDRDQDEWLQIVHKSIECKDDEADEHRWNRSVNA